MFDELLESSETKQRTAQGWAIIGSASFQLACLLVLILIPLIYTQALPKATLLSILIAPAPPPPPPPPETSAQRRAPRRSYRFLENNVLRPPTVIPERILMVNEMDFPLDAGEGDWPGREDFSLVDLVTVAEPEEPPAPPPPGPVVEPRRIRLGGNVQAAKIVSRPQPVYPALARQTTLQGTVVLHAIIDVEGRVSELEVLGGHPILARAAIDAVARWRYQPTLLNGEAVEVDTTITVNFVLGR